MKKRGFTLIEVIVAATILILVVAGTLGVVLFGRRTTSRSGRMLEAENAVVNRLESWKNSVSADWSTNASNPLHDASGTWSANTSSGGAFGQAPFSATWRYNVSYPAGYVGGGNDTYKIVTLQVHWNEPAQ